jgi:TorA maturation chaperone TorD
MTSEECAQLYHLLALSFACPDAGFAERLTRLIGELRLETWDSDSAGQPILPIAPFIRELAAFDQQKLTQIQQECQRLFAQDSPEALCPAQAWAYRPDLPREVLTQAAQSAYLAWGQKIPPTRTTKLETQLEFLAYLCRHADDEAAQSARRDFLYQQALVWLLHFADKVVLMTRLDFYRAAAQLLTAFLKLEAGAQFGAA